MSERTLLCPSARCAPGALLVGIAMPDGRIAYAADQFVVDEEFVRTAQTGRTPEGRFRFASRCAQGACRQWTGTHCGVIERVLELAPDGTGEAELPACSIRAQCRWHQQQGTQACFVCPLVITDART